MAGQLTGELPGIPVVDQDVVVRPTKVVALVRNYAAHALEMDSRVPQEVISFLRPPTSLLPGGGEVVLPGGTDEIHHEVELAVVVGKRLTGEVDLAEAGEAIFGYAVFIDFTNRKLQAQLKAESLPWSRAKGWDTSGPISPILPAAAAPPEPWTLRLTVNGEVRQEGTTAQQTNLPAEVLKELATWVTLEPGDVVATGTPKGVGPVKAGDEVVAMIEGIGEVRCTIVNG